MYRPTTSTRSNNNNSVTINSRTSTPVATNNNNSSGTTHTPRNAYNDTTKQQQIFVNSSFGYVKAEENSSINKPVLVVARVRDFAPLEDPSRRAVFVTGQRTCFVQLPHQRGKIEFLVDSVIGGSGENDIDPRTGAPYFHPQIHHRRSAVEDDASKNNNNSNVNFGYDYHSRHPNVISSPKSSAFAGAGSQEALFEAVGAPLVDCVVQGRNATIIAYGSTNSGKTFSSFGPPDSLGTPLEGLIPRMARGIFDACNSAQGFFHTNVSVTILEVFLEDVYDLLDPARPKLKLRGDTTKGFAPVGETCVRVTSYDQICVLLADAEKRRTTLDVTQDHRSSRSHVLFFLHLQRYMANNGTELSSKLLVADLAGSERTHHKEDPNNTLLSHLYQHEQAMKFESAISINMSLLALGSVIEAAASREGNVTQQQLQKDAQTLLPEFRRSTLTKLMKDHIGGNSRTVVLVTVSPTSESAYNSIQALRFGQRAMKVRTHSRINVALRGTASFGNTSSSSTSAGKTNNSLNSSNKNQQQQQPQVDPVLEKLRAKMNKRRALVEVECTLEEELFKARRKVQQLENDLCRSPLVNSNSATLQMFTSDILEMRTRELEQAIAEESRIERDLYTLFDCPGTSENNNNNNFIQDSDFVNDDNVEAEECTLFAVVRKRHEAELSDVRAQAWKTSNSASVGRLLTASSPPFKQQQQQTSPLNRNSNNNNNFTTPTKRENQNIIISPSNNKNQMTSPSSPSREQLEKLLAAANEELEQMKERLADREDKSAKLAQKLLLAERSFNFRTDLDYIEQREEALARSSIEQAQLKFLSELKCSYMVDRTRLEYYGHLRKSMIDDSKERAFGGERERQLRRELEESRKDTRKWKEEAEGLQIKLEIAESERTQFTKESDARWKRVVELEHLVEVLKNENGQLVHHAEVLKAHYEHQVNLHDLQHERLKNDTQMSLQRFKFDGQRGIDELTHRAKSSPPAKTEEKDDAAAAAETAIAKKEKLEERIQKVEKALLQKNGEAAIQTAKPSESRESSQSENYQGSMADSLTTSQLSTVNRYYATILAERERLNHLMNAADHVEQQSHQQNPDHYSSYSSKNYNNHPNDINNVSEPEYHQQQQHSSSPTNYQKQKQSSTSGGYVYPTSMSSSHLHNNNNNNNNNSPKRSPLIAPSISNASSSSSSVIAAPAIQNRHDDAQQQHQEYKNYYIPEERLKLLEQQLALERQRAEQKRQLSEQQQQGRQPSLPSSSYYQQHQQQQQQQQTNGNNNNFSTTTTRQTHHQQPSTSQISAHQQNQSNIVAPRYAAETISSQNRSYHSFDPNSNNNNEIYQNAASSSSSFQQQQQQQQTRSISPSWTMIQNSAAQQIYRGNNYSSRPGNVAQENVIGSPKYHPY